MWLNFINKDAAWLGNTLILNISPFKQIKDNFQKITKILCELGKITLPLQIVVVCLNGRINGHDFERGQIVGKTGGFGTTEMPAAIRSEARTFVYWHDLLVRACGGRFCGVCRCNERRASAQPGEQAPEDKRVTQTACRQWGARSLCKELRGKEFRHRAKPETEPWRSHNRTRTRSERDQRRAGKPRSGRSVWKEKQ